MVAIKQDEINPLIQYVYTISGIKLDATKTYLFETRLGPLLRSLGISSYRALMQAGRNDASKTIENQIIDAISTNETLFFRDAAPFEALQHKILPDLIDARSAKGSGLLRPTLSIWSAACSTGQEVYSIAIVLKEFNGLLDHFRIKLIGTDISDAAIAQASYGHYNKFEIERGLPANKLTKYFFRDGAQWKVKDELRAMVTFRKLNLMQPFVGLGKFDVILCRNVAIYFSPEDRKRLFEKIYNVLEPDGFLLIGGSESLTGVTDRFVPQRHVRTLVYRPRPR